MTLINQPSDTLCVCFSDIELLALFVACLSHDIDHRGTTNSFQIASVSGHMTQAQHSYVVAAGQWLCGKGLWKICLWTVGYTWYYDSAVNVDNDFF